MRKPFATLYQLLLAVLASLGFWFSLLALGSSAWRLFSTWVLLAATLYFLADTVVAVFMKRRASNNFLAPTFLGMIIVSLATSGLAALVFSAQGWGRTGLPAGLDFLVYLVIPVLVFLDWAIFAKKGTWRAADPFYWLAPAATYAAAILFTAMIFPDVVPLYPLAFLDYQSFDLGDFFLALALFGLLILVLGYLLLLADAYFGGRLSPYILLPHLKTVAAPEKPKK